MFENTLATVVAQGSLQAPRESVHQIFHWSLKSLSGSGYCKLREKLVILDTFRPVTSF